MQDQKFEQWCLVELFGHSRIAGLVTESTIGGATFIRVDVPETTTQPKFTRLLNPSAIYAINPIDKDTAVHLANNLYKKPIDSWDIKQVVEKQKLQLGQAVPDLSSRGLDENDDDDMPGFLK
jgi:hypothetical protein